MTYLEDNSLSGRARRRPCARQRPPCPEEQQMIGESSPAYHYNTSVAMEFFRFAGRPKTFAKGKKIFSENQKGIPFLLMPNRMYLLLDGEVVIFSGDTPVATVRPGQIFGEMASIDQGPRSGTAVTKSVFFSSRRRHTRCSRDWSSDVCSSD